MADITYVLALLYSVTVGVALVIHGGYRLGKDRRDGNGIVETLAGVAIISGLVLLQLQGLLEVPNELLTTGLLGKVLALVAIVGALVSVDYLLARVWPLTVRFLGRRSDDTASRTPPGKSNRDISRSRRTVMGVTLGVVTASLLASTSYLHSRSDHDTSSPTQSGTPLTIQAAESSGFTMTGSFEIPERSTALAFGDRGDGYLTTLSGSVYRFDRPSSSTESIQFDEVASDIRFPQGVEVVDGTLYTVDIGEIRDSKMGTLRNSDASVIAFDIQSDGSLDNRRTILSELPVVDRQHSPNGITTGPDGRLYLSIGHFGPQLVEDGEYNPSTDIHPNIEFLGTVLSFDPDGSNVEVMARGLRNVYDIAFDSDGDLFGADNDGPTARSMQLDTLYHLVEGGDYGFPEYGSVGGEAFDEETRDPLWVFNKWPSGIETSDKIGYENGVLVGLWKGVKFVPIAKDEDGLFVPEAAQNVISIRGDFPPIVDASPEGFLYVGTFNSNELAVFRTSS